MAKKDAIPTSRLSRSSKVGKLAATQAARQMGTRATNMARSDEGKQRALAKRQLETAEQIVAALGTMKGAAMKLGQVMSFLDVGLVPEEFREEFQAKLAELRDAAPKVSFKDMKKVIEGQYGARIDDVFQTFDPVPIAAASIGQVYRARLDDGRDVAVKVQYPGVAQAVRADMQNLGIILWLMKSVAPGLDPKAMGDEIRSRIDEELDYELEAQNQRTLARIYRGHPFIVVPAVVTSLSHEKVIVTEFVSGRGFEELKQLPQDERDRLGEIIFRFYFGCMYRHHQFSGDPHPGNSLLLDDGRMAFLDFGLFKRIPAAVAEFELEVARLGIAGDGVALIEHLHEGGFIGRPELYTPEGILSQVHDMTWWYGVDQEVALTPEIATEIMIEMSDPRSSHFAKMRHETLPPDHLFGRRLEMLTLAVMGQLRSRGNWHRIAREWIYGDPPVTELGRREAEFYAAHPPAAVLRGAA
jgi:predicted unusual protein kinase regulating ubiquinone biosynthesis (AarF/ABC1/UbiB family)